MSDLEYAQGYVAGVKAAIDIVETSEALDRDLGRPPRSEGLKRALKSALQYGERVVESNAVAPQDDAHPGEHARHDRAGHTPSKGKRT